MNPTKFKLFGAFLTIAASGQPGLAAMPTNPDRPLVEPTCVEARRRVEEVRLGSPLLSREENEQQLQRALRLMEQLCDNESVRR